MVNKYRVLAVYPKQLAKFVLVTLSSLFLLTTVLTVPALARVKEGAEKLSTSSWKNTATSISKTVSNAAISYNDATQTVTISGNCNTDEIYAFMHDDGPGANAKTLHFSGTSVIQTLQNNQSDAPFAQTSLQNVTADKDATVSFSASGSARFPTLRFMFYECNNLTSINGLSSWDVSNVTGDECMAGMFYRCALTSLNGLELWNVSNVTGAYCMWSMFCSCPLTSLDGLSAWNVSKVEGLECMYGIFQDCGALVSIDGIASWNYKDQGTGSNDMFSGDAEVSSLTVNPSDGFELTSSMKIPSTFATGGNYWWPMKGADKGISTNDLYFESSNTNKYGNRWVRSEENVNPYITDAMPTVTWTTIAKPYSGLNQTIGPDKVEVGGIELRAGIDYTVRYVQDTTQGNEQKSYPVVRDEGSYTAELYLQGNTLGKKILPISKLFM